MSSRAAARGHRIGPSRGGREVAMTSDVRTRDAGRHLAYAARTGVREVTAIWWWFLILGVLWTGLGMFVLSYRVGSLAVVAALTGVAFLFGVVHLIGALTGPKLAWWWTGLLLGAAELVLGVWAVHSWQRSPFTLVTLVGVWAVFHGVNEIFAAFSVREIGRRAEQIIS